MAFSSAPVLDTKTALRIGPLNRAIDTCDHAGATFQTTGEFDHHLSLFVERIEVRWTGINAKSFFAAVTDLLVEPNVGFFVVFKGIER
jgi:hypothetical protein